MSGGGPGVVIFEFIIFKSSEHLQIVPGEWSYCYVLYTQFLFKKYLFGRGGGGC